MAKGYICIVAAVLWGVSGLSLGAGKSKIKFSTYELKAKTGEILHFDFDGDGLNDIVVINEPNLIFFFQNHKGGFANEPELVYSMGDRASILWPAKLGKGPAESILVMTNDGVSSLTCAGRTTPPKSDQIISRRTIVPEKSEDSHVFFFTLSANTAKEFPVIFIPTENGLEVWENSSSDRWRYAYALKEALKSSIGGPWNEYVYSRSYYLHMSVGDVSGDGLEDLLICDNDYGSGTSSMIVYEQNKAGRFESKVAKTFENVFEEHTWFCVIDINKDGKADLIRNTWLREPWFIPGTYSGKVLVRIFISAADGSLPEQAQYVFRKNDWMASMPIVDIDGDGFVDLVLGHSLFKLDDHRRSLSVQKIAHSLRIHFCDKGSFRQEPDCQKDMSIYISHRDMALPGHHRDYFEHFINLEGDFNGDGCRDLAVKDTKDGMSVYFFRSRRKGFSRKTDIHLETGKMCRFIVRDLNRDGVSDLVAYYPWREQFKVLLSRRN